MALSMTGYGCGKALVNGRSITVELRSVNARYFEYSSRLPRSCSFMDDRLKKLVNRSVSRGKVELNLQIQAVDTPDITVTVDLPLARQYREALRQLHEELRVSDDASTGMLARFPDVLTVTHAQADPEQLWQDVRGVAEQALAGFLQMRQAEGQKLREDIAGRLELLEKGVDLVEQQSAGRVEAYTRRLYEKLRVILEDREIDDSRVLTEAAIFADKTAVDEETVRLRSHIQQYRDILAMDGAIGRKLDFLTQEMNRETNTIGSKCQDIEITRTVVEMKAEIEKIREQIQNLE